MGPTGLNPACCTSIGVHFVYDDICAMAPDKSIHVGAWVNSDLAVDSFWSIPAEGDTRDGLSSVDSTFGYDVAAYPVVELYADWLTIGVLDPAAINASGI